MPQGVTRTPAAGSSVEAAIGFCGKIPARGDFVRAGLPRAFADPWDRWIGQMIAASRAALGEAWLPAWLEAPIWRFALSAGICGPHAVVGLWLPSVDRIGRYYPLTIAAVAGHTRHPTLMHEAGGFLANAECAGRDALKDRLEPSELAARLAAAASAAPVEPGIDPARFPSEGAFWWTEGGPRVPSAALASPALPDQNTFIAMVDPCTPTLPVPCPHSVG
jgi:type VI secretion system protein ImpM